MLCWQLVTDWRPDLVTTAVTRGDARWTVGLRVVPCSRCRHQYLPGAASSAVRRPSSLWAQPIVSRQMSTTSSWSCFPSPSARSRRHPGMTPWPGGTRAGDQTARPADATPRYQQNDALNLNLHFSIGCRRVLGRRLCVAAPGSSILCPIAAPWSSPPEHVNTTSGSKRRHISDILWLSCSFYIPEVVCIILQNK